MADVILPYSTRARRASSSRCSPTARTAHPRSSRAARPKGCTRRRALSPKDGSGAVIDEKTWGDGVTLGHAGALDHLVAIPAPAADAASARRRSAIASCTADSSTREPVRVDAAGSRGAREIRSARAAAPAAQPGADPGAARTPAGSAAGRLLRYRVPSRAAAGRAGVRAAGVDHRARRASATAFMACRTNTSRACCREYDARAAAGKVVVLHLGNGSSMCAMAGGRSVASTMGFTAVDGLPMGTRCGSLDPGVVLYLMDELEMDARAIEKLIYQQSGPARRVGHFERHAHARRRATIRARRRRSTSSSTGSGASSARSRRRSAGSTRSCSPRASARTAAACASASAATPRGSASSSTATRTRARRADQHGREPRLGVGHSDQRGADDRAPHGSGDRCGRAEGRCMSHRIANVRQGKRDMRSPAREKASC